MTLEFMTTTGVQRVSASGGFCWLCGLPAVCGERLPGRRHRTRLLCRTHAEYIFGPQPAGDTAAEPPR